MIGKFIKAFERQFCNLKDFSLPTALSIEETLFLFYYPHSAYPAECHRYIGDVDTHVRTVAPDRLLPSQPRL